MLSSIEDSASHNTSEHCALREEQGAVSIGTPTQKGETRATVRMGRNEIQVESRYLPEKAKPDEEPQVPAQEHKLRDRDTDKNVPVASRSQVPASVWQRIPRCGVDRDSTVPEPQAKRIDNNEKSDFDWDGI